MRLIPERVMTVPRCINANNPTFSAMPPSHPAKRGFDRCQQSQALKITL
jgi:hypothetical protein